MKSLKLHDSLTTNLYRLEKTKNIDPILRIINGENLSKLTRSQVVAWVEAHTPFIFNSKSDGSLKARMRKDGVWRTREAQHSPYWTLNTSAFKKATNSNSITARQPPIDVNFERSKKLLKKAFENYMLEPSRMDLDNLCTQLEDYLQYRITAHSFLVDDKIFLPSVKIISGGLPSLGKRSK